MKKLYIFVLIIAVVSGMFAVVYFVPQKTELNKVIDCYDGWTNEKVVVEVCGTYKSFRLKNDVFEGTIAIQGGRMNEGIFEFENDKYSNMWDEYGQPMEMILQFEQFSYISIFSPSYMISSEWDLEN